jgi:hypothetical protein
LTPHRRGSPNYVGPNSDRKKSIGFEYYTCTGQEVDEATVYREEEGYEWEEFPGPGDDDLLNSEQKPLLK